MTTETNIQSARLLKNLNLSTGMMAASASVFVLLAFAAGIAFLVQILLARLLGPDQFGVYSLVITWVLTLSLFVSLGLDSAVMRFVAAYRAMRQFGALRGILRRTNQIAALVSAISAACMISIAHQFSRNLFCPFLMGALLLPFVTLLQLNSKVILALRRPASGVILGSLLRHFILCALILASGFAFHVVKDAATALALASMSAIIVTVTGYCFISLVLPAEARASSVEYHTREWFGVALPMLAVTAAEQVLARGDIIVLGFFRPKAEVGVYAAAISLATIMDMIMTAVNSVIAPTFAELHAQERLADLQGLLTKAARVAFFTILPISITLMVFGKQILRIFGGYFVAANTVLSLLAIAYLVRSFTGSVGLLLSMTGLHSLFAKVLVTTVTATLALDFFLIPRYGMTGAASATLLGVLLRSVILSLVAATKLRTIPTAIGPVLSKATNTSPVAT